jgi:hypothetical protein
VGRVESAIEVVGTLNRNVLHGKTSDARSGIRLPEVLGISRVDVLPHERDTAQPRDGLAK